MNIKQTFDKSVKFITEDIWVLQRKDLSKGMFRTVAVAKVVVLAVQKFQRDACKDKASALTYYTLLSLVPLLALAFGVAKAFGFDTVLTQALYASFKGHESVAEYMVSFVDMYLSNIKGGLIAGVGFGMLLWTVMSLIGHMEQVFNQIWGFAKSRTLVRKFSDYISIVLIALIGVTAYSSLVINLTSYLTHHDEVMRRIWLILLSASPFLLMWIGLALIYYILPNGKIRFWPALLGGVIAGTALMVTQFVYLYFQIGMSKNNAVYGGFAALPLFLVWLQMTWHLIMLGCEVAYAAQNYSQHELQSDTKRFSIELRRKVALYISAYVARRFALCESAATVGMMAHDLNMPKLLVVRMAQELASAGILIEVSTTDKEDVAYMPAFDIAQLTVARFIDMCERNGATTFDNSCPGFEKVEEVTKHLAQHENSVATQTLVKDILI